MRTGTQMLESDRTAVGRRGLRIAAAILVAAAATACGDLQRQGQASSYLIVNNAGGRGGLEHAVI